MIRKIIPALICVFTLVLFVGCADSELAILDATVANDMSKVKKLVKRGNSVNVKNAIGQTPLIVASTKGSLEIAAFLIDNGADLNAQDDLLEEGAIHLALRADNQRMLQLLLSKGADPNLTGDSKKTPLLYAIDRQNVDFIKLLLRFEADPNIADKVGIRPLWKSLMLNNAELVSLLLENGAEIKAGENADIFDAVFQCDLEIVDLMIQHGADVNQTSSRYGNPLCMAVKRKNIEVMKYLLKMGADVTVRDHEGKTALDIAIDDDNVQMFEILDKVTGK